MLQQAAMREVDIDGSGTMDFYEYLQVALLLEQKKGKSEPVAIIFTTLTCVCVRVVNMTKSRDQTVVEI